MPYLELRLFGAFEIKLDGKPLVAFGTEKVRGLLAYLAIEADQPHSRERLAGLLWPEQPEKQAQHNFRQALSTLRKLLRDENNPQAFIHIVGDSVQFNRSSNHCVDVREFHKRLDAGLQYYSRHSHPGRINLPLLNDGLGVYRGEFLAQFSLSESSEFDEWVIMQREHCNQRAIQAYSLLAEYHEKREEFLLARQIAEKLVELAPWDETAHLQVVRLLAQDGQWSLAQARYQSLRRNLVEQMGLEPSAETVAVFEEMRKYAAAQKPFPPRSMPPQHNLRLPATPFIGREAELRQLAALFANPDNHLVTLLGIGGTGKSRLALQFAYTQIACFPDGVWLIPVNERALIPGLAQALHFTPNGNDDLITQLCMLLARKRLLLLLDGFEHIQDETPLLADILSAAPGISVLSTSRQRLDLRDEILVPLEGLEIPPENIQTQEQAEHFSASALFLSRARRLRPDIQLLPGEYSALADICRLLEGLPLGLELAAAATWTHTTGEIAAEIHRGLDFLNARTADQPSRHRSLRAAFDYSWKLLNPEQQTAFARLAVFKGSFLASAGTAVTQADPAMPGELLNRSLLRQTPNGRLEIPEPILPYAAEQLDTNPGENTAMHDAHAAYYAALFASQEEVLAGADMPQAIELLLPELGNIRQAWNYAICNQAFSYLDQMLEALHQLLYTRSAFQEAIGMFTSSLALPLDSLLEARLRIRLGLHQLRAGNFKGAQEILAQGLDIARRSDDTREIILALSYLSNLYRKTSQKSLALECTEELLRLSEMSNDLSGIKSALFIMAEFDFKAGNQAEARAAMQKCLRTARQIGNPIGILTPLNSLGDYACQEEDYSQALQIFEECLGIARALGSQFHISMHLNNLGTVHHLLGEYALAQTCYAESCQICQDIGDLEGEGIALSNLGEIAMFQNDLEQALDYYTQALTIAEQTHSDWIAVIAWINSGKAYRAMQDLPKAWEYLQKGLQSAWCNEMLANTMKALAHMGSLLLDHGSRAVGLQALSAVRVHPASEPEDRLLAGQLLEKFSQDSAENQSLEKLVEDLLHAPFLDNPRKA